MQYKVALAGWQGTGDSFLGAVYMRDVSVKLPAVFTLN
jgi:hypothetical protein